ncbi:MAG: hypothetical protein MAG795_00260 [Candidatus Woesearchaeota archaeon]|nr:hypothetical protein [Candidatus Woesearchaeota archaeon]
MTKKKTHSHHGHHHDSTTNIKTAFFLNLSFTIIEIVGGIFTQNALGPNVRLFVLIMLRKLRFPTARGFRPNAF